MSIKLDKEKHEKDNFKTLIKQALLNPNYETEVIIGGNMHLGSNITYHQFKKVFNRIRGKSQFHEMPDQHKLIITFDTATKFKDIRVIINGFNAINTFCITEKLDKIIYSLEFQRKTLVNEKINKININNYNFKLNQKQEETLDIDSTIVRECMKSWKELGKIYRYKKTYRFMTTKSNQKKLFSIDCSVVRNSSFEDIMMTKSEVVKKDLFHNVVKPREDKRQFIEWWKSITPTTQVQVRHIQTFHKTLKASKCFEAALEYELEIELHQTQIIHYYKDILGIDKDTPNLKSYDNVKKLMLDLNNDQRSKVIDYIFGLFFENIGLCLQCCQSSFYLVGNNDMYNIIKDYKRLTNQRGGTDTLFFGSLPIDLNIENCVEYHKDVISTGVTPTIIYDYAVSEKIDGERCLLYIDKDGECYLIERNGDVLLRKMGIQMPTTMGQTILDGEYIEYDKSGTYLNKLYAFDCYFYAGKNIMDYPFSTNKGRTDTERLFFINKTVKQFKEGMGVKSENKDLRTSAMNFKLDRVSFYFGESSSTPLERQQPEMIFSFCNELLNKMNAKYGGLLQEGHLFSYPTDGLIFTPCLKGVYEKFNYDIKSDVMDDNMTSQSGVEIDNDDKSEAQSELSLSLSENSSKSSIKSNKSTKTKQKNKTFKTTYGKKWESFFKWKPRQYLTMDLRVNIVKKAGCSKRELHYEGNRVYAITNLMCSNYTMSGNRNSMNAITSNHNRNLSKEGEHILLPSVNPSIGMKQELGNGLVFTDTIHQCYLPISTLHEDEIRCANGDIIYNGSIVEFKYDHEEAQEMMRWKPIRVRHGKKANAVSTCLDIWQLMNLSFDTSTISGYEQTQTLIRNFPDQLLMPNIYLKGNEYTGDNHFQIISNSINRYMVMNHTSGFSNPSAMIFGCGNMNDFGTYIESKCSRIIAFDNNSRVLNDKDDGAGAIISSSYSDVVKRLRYNTLLVNADLSKDITDPLLTEDSDFGVDGLNGFYLDIIYGREKVSEMETKKLRRFENLGVEGVHMIIGGANILNDIYSTEEHLNNFLNNVSTNLKDQGYFITTFVDGFKVCELLTASGEDKLHQVINKQGQTVYEFKGEKESSITYNITKDGHIPCGTSYERYVLGKPSYHTEYAVDSLYIEKLCMEKGLKVVECRTITDEPASYYDESVFLAKDKLGDNYKNDHFKEYYGLCKSLILQKDNTLLSG